ncbi:hypothetical protein ATE66_15685 [Sphingopyxis sp. H107]|nr:hypothetical protein ATE61_03350 [Sphingopyxis sp. H057]KTE54349.1 hypothetical protein ATE64_03355 [Sphingopyxis sp. H073]KTE58270.1 hypothetical protein ATE66_15685 [Sphingopyxis sp. H107]KTE68208.1 hypothetical protein ATE65_02245 [Sphingopyxis sp. H100]KTE72075.1 hypothetical protein ATE60_11575 [Sphingopyxis sp. H081]KTE80550.1 hypothetical protein ATE63_10895 [Sphingopyxis sp. H067]
MIPRRPILLGPQIILVDDQAFAGDQFFNVRYTCPSPSKIATRQDASDLIEICRTRGGVREVSNRSCKRHAAAIAADIARKKSRWIAKYPYRTRWVGMDHDVPAPVLSQQPLRIIGRKTIALADFKGLDPAAGWASRKEMTDNDGPWRYRDRRFGGPYPHARDFESRRALLLRSRTVGRHLDLNSKPAGHQTAKIGR